MGYAKIPNLYKDQKILAFKECYALEKVHGTSAHITLNKGQLTFFAGGASHEMFCSLFDKEALLAKFSLLGRQKVTVYGEAYGGKLLKMSDVYGKDLKFIAFDVMIDDKFLDVPDMDRVASELGFEVVPWVKVSTDLAGLDALRDAPSEVAVRRGMGSDKIREGVVLRPPFEVLLNNGERVCAKHKGKAFEERVNQPKVSNLPPEVLAEAEAIANEWVTDMRLTHVLGKLELNGVELGMADTPRVMAAMLEDVYAEAAGEIVPSKDAERVIKQRAAKLFKRRVTEIKW